MEPATSHPFDA